MTIRQFSRKYATYKDYFVPWWYRWYRVVERWICWRIKR